MLFEDQKCVCEVEQSTIVAVLPFIKGFFCRKFLDAIALKSCIIREFNFSSFILNVVLKFSYQLMYLVTPPVVNGWFLIVLYLMYFKNSAYRYYCFYFQVTSRLTDLQKDTVIILRKAHRAAR